MRYALILLLVFFIGCKQKPDRPKHIPVTDAFPPVETEPANTDYPPAFKGQTRVAGVKTGTSITHKIITKDLSRPWGMALMPDGNLLVTQKEGTMKIVTPAGELSADITGLPKVDSRGQGGLLDVALDPDFKTNGLIYWTFSEPQPGGNLTAVGKGVLDVDALKVHNVKVIFRATPAYDGTLHYGSRLVFAPDGNLFVSTGERSDKETRQQAQDLKSGLGKIFRITPDGAPAPGNPTFKQAMPGIYSYGHRNPQGLALHPQTGALWSAEFGPMGGDELNLIQPGKNYGWPTITYGVEYSGDAISNKATRREGMEQPVYYWDPVLSPSGMVFYNSDAIPEWKNNLFIGGLSSNHICRLVIRNNRVVGEERLLANEFQRFRDVSMAANGGLYAITDDGRLYWIGKKMKRSNAGIRIVRF